jgi:hypothetical protein
MGMYDYVTCRAPLPLTEELAGLGKNWADLGFQTKCLDNDLAHYIIESDGYLYIENIEREYIEYTEEELKTIKPKPWSVFKEVVIKSKTIEKVEYHGSVIFYDVVDYSEAEDLWVEFSASFIYGKLDKIELIKSYKMKANHVIMLEFEAEQRKRQARPWYKFKAAVGPYGWRRFWLIMTRLCGKTSELAGKIQNLIFRHML